MVFVPTLHRDPELVECVLAGLTLLGWDPQQNLQLDLLSRFEVRMEPLGSGGEDLQADLPPVRRAVAPPEVALGLEVVHEARDRAPADPQLAGEFLHGQLPVPFVGGAEGVGLGWGEARRSRTLAFLGLNLPTQLATLGVEELGLKAEGFRTVGQGNLLSVDHLLRISYS
jgi:hypothetical protein